MPDKTAQETPSPISTFPKLPSSSSAAISRTQSPAITRSGQFSRAAAATALFDTYTKHPNTMAIIMMKLTFLKLKLNSSAACGMASNPTYAQGAIAKVARIALSTPAVPVCAYWEMFAVTAPAAFAAALSKPQIGRILTPFALALNTADKKRTKTQVTRRLLRIVCTIPAFLTPIMFSQPKRISTIMDRSISPI